MDNNRRNGAPSKLYLTLPAIVVDRLQTILEDGVSLGGSYRPNGGTHDSSLAEHHNDSGVNQSAIGPS